MSGPTRSYGLLEKLLAARRAAMADSLIPDRLRRGTLLDLGCGVTPYFLLRTSFAHKVGLDLSLELPLPYGGIGFIRQDLTELPWPFEPDRFSATTMLAVVEHLTPADVVPVFSECYRVLHPGGVLVITHPAGWTGPLLKAMARVRLVSRVEIDDHKDACGSDDVAAQLVASGFAAAGVRSGSFEFGANRWVCAVK